MTAAILGAGAAGSAIAKLLLAAGARDLLCCAGKGIINRARLPALDASKAWLAQHQNFAKAGQTWRQIGGG